MKRRQVKCLKKYLTPPPYNSIVADNAAHFTDKEDGCYPKPPSYNVATSLPSYDEAEMTKAEAAVPLVPEREEEFKSGVPDTVASLPPHSSLRNSPSDKSPPRRDSRECCYCHEFVILLPHLLPGKRKLRKMFCGLRATHSVRGKSRKQNKITVV